MIVNVSVGFARFTARKLPVNWLLAMTPVDESASMLMAAPVRAVEEPQFANTQRSILSWVIPFGATPEPVILIA